MNAKTIIIAVVALAVATATGLLIQSWMNAQREAMLRSMPKAPKATGAPKVMVARKPLPAGTFLKPEHVEWRAWPKNGISKAYLLKGKRAVNELVGAVVRRGITAGEPITDGRIVKPGERGFMAAVLTPGMRAVSVPINATTGIAGFVFPGDRVDLILTHKLKSGSGKKKKVTQVSETVLTGVRVLGMDQKSDDQKGKGKGKGKVKVPKTTTIEVTPKQAEMITVAKEIGKLSLSLRSLAIEEVSGLPAALPMGPARRGRSITRASEVSRLIGLAPKRPPTITVLRGNNSGSKKAGAK
jgi:pilus assembly protein CpaB